ncbi:ABC transporter ATP-binding protein [Angustibacter luteus]|uniref:ATP-binding cassette domain-containing protein n=1 Tax=Angustibacter luteus TaxID=658456 RepID=A0ABW1JHF6_9ACTN
MSKVPHVPEADPRTSGPASGTPGLVATQVRKLFGERAVVDGISLQVDPGEVLALVGGNGSGKTTLLRILTGAIDPDDGEVTWQGRSLDESDPWVRREVAVLLDDAETFPDLSVLEHVELLARAFGLDDARPHAQQVLDEVGLTRQAGQLPTSLSSGQRHRLGLASVLVRPAGLVVLDEPEQRLDDAGRTWLSERLRRLADDGAAIVLASHDEQLVEDVAHLVLELG